MSAMLARAALTVGLLGALAAAPAAAARVPAGVPDGADLWATVNLCDTARHPDTVGIRASMPGRPRGTQRRMRFRLQWRDGDRWRYVTGADSGWRRLSRARGRPVASGWSFEFAPPAKAISFRGVVRYRWLKRGRVVGRAVEITEAGHHSTTGSDPEGYSAATCSIG
ncbi:MAG: hypothetical protein ACRDK0_01965 [Solirubrobacteraceae bacterium]